MTLLVLGVLIWSATHLLPCAGPQLRSRLVAKLGEQPYKGVFSLAILASVALIVLGWRSIEPTLVYTPSGAAYTAAELGMLGALLLFAASGMPTNLKRFIRHPQLTGVLLWSGAHLLANGDRRSLVLFGGLGAWAILSILFSNRRDGKWERPQPVPIASEIKLVGVAVVVWGVLFLLHPYFAGPTLSLPW